MSASERLTSVVSDKGQVILPKVVLERRDWPPGTKRVVEEMTDGVLLRRAPLFDAKQLSDVFAMLKTDDRRRTVEVLDSAVLRRTRP